MISSQPWGSTGGQPVELFTLSSGAGMTVAVATYGGAVQSVRVPDRAGRTVNVVLGFDCLDRYLDARAADAYFGAIVGRYANRIAGHSFVLDGRRHELAHAPGDRVTLHGGPGGYHTRPWKAAPARIAGGAALRLSYVDPDGRNGFPGTVRNEIVYAVTPDNALRIEYRASCDAATVVNLTNHTYFNLAGENAGDVYSQLLAVNAGVFQPVDETQIPVGFAGVAGTPFEFRAMKPIGRDIRAVDEPLGEQLALGGGYDHNWVLAGAGYRSAAVAWDPGTGIVMWTYTDQPGLQVYAANHLTGELVGTGGRAYGEGGGFALETQRFPDAPHHIDEPGWPSVVLRPGEVLRTRTTYKFGLAGSELAERVRF
ncbi:MAG: galactose mutarotase [Solirubrobacterales bacterium]|nr:galactose mutarotase [Solirubrobacterales bacterium]MBV9945169.1 galactose mutarotase [Solirubrobacterales bacterium]